MKLANLLLENGTDVNLSNNKEKAPLMLACDKGNTEIVSLLIESSANINDKDTDEWSPLMFASYNGYREIVELLEDINFTISIMK